MTEGERMTPEVDARSQNTIEHGGLESDGFTALSCSIILHESKETLWCTKALAGVKT